MTFRSSVVAVGLAGLVASACLFGENAFGQRRELSRAKAVQVQDEDKKDKDKKAKLDVIYYGVSSCNNKGCHGGDPPKSWIKGKNGEQLDLLVRCNEADVFEKKDKHADAYKSLEGDLGKLMAKNLGYDVTKKPECLNCHGVVISDAKVKENSEKIGYDLKDGVSCAACHGAHPEWIANHALMVTAVKFRPLSRKEKEDKYGLIDLRNPVRRTELCASCHVGSVKENKFVTHDMYAAGHPPLPGFEVATFSNEEPRHWQLLRDKPKAVQKELGFGGEREETLLVLIGGAIAFRDTMTLLNDQAKKAIDKKDKLDLSNYDCWACHHPLEQKWRQNNEWLQGRKPGKVPMRDWSAEIVRLSIAYLEMKAEKDKGQLKKDFESKLKNLTDAFNKGVGGDLKEIQAASADLKTWSESLAEQIGKNPPQKADLRKLLEAISSLYGKRVLGYDSAREVAWAAEVILNEMEEKRNSGDDDYKSSLVTTDSALKLRLPRGRGSKVIETLNENMKAIDAFNPFDFRKKFDADLSKLLKVQ